MPLGSPGSLATFDRMIFKRYLTRLYPGENVRCLLWTQAVALKDVTAYAKATTERIANNARTLVTDRRSAGDLRRSCEDPQERFAHRAWPRVLNVYARMLNPILPAIGAADYGGYYRVLDQADIATDVMFTTRPTLVEIGPDLVRHATLNLSSQDVSGFLGRKLHPALAAEVVTDAERRPEDWRTRHRMAGNWIKVYDKASVLREETVINNPREFADPARRVGGQAHQVSSGRTVRRPPPIIQDRLGVGGDGGPAVLASDGTTHEPAALGREYAPTVRVTLPNGRSST
jgi:hypothetical protein